jgi:hypothetical protein
MTQKRNSIKCEMMLGEPARSTVIIEQITVTTLDPPFGKQSLGLGPTVTASHNGTVVNVRPPTAFDKAIQLNLAAAKEPRRFLEVFSFDQNGEEDKELHRSAHAAVLARDASATVIVLCANKFESMVNWCCTSLDPLLNGSSELLIRDSRLSSVDLAKLLYSLCGEKFDTGKLPCAPMPLIFQLRNLLVHDKPMESLEKDISESIEYWRKQLLSKVSDLDWLPLVRNVEGGPLFWIFGEAAVQKVMKYPVAQWAADATEAIVFDMRRLVSNRTSGVHVIDRGKIPRFNFEDPKASTRRGYAAGR